MNRFDTIPFYIETRRMQPPETRVHSLLYVSTPTALPNPLEMARIIATASANNLRENLSGLLLWSDASFAQLLEGPEDAVEAMFARIRRDARHRDVRPVMRRSSPGRRFVGGPMALVRLSDQDGWRLLQRRTVPGNDDLGRWLFALMLSLRAAAARDPRRIGAGARGAVPAGRRALTAPSRRETDGAPRC